MTFLELLDEYGIVHADSPPNGDASLRSHFRPGWEQLEHCPRCDTDRWRLGYNIAQNYAVCWSCGYVSLASILHDKGMPWQQCKELLGGIERTQETEQRIKPRGKLILPPNLGVLQVAHRKYLVKRGFNPDRIQKFWDVRGIGISHRLQWRLFIPIHYQGEVVSWTTRALVDDGTRYVNAGEDEERLPAKQLLYGEDHCSHTIIVLEGPLDAWAVGPGAVATLGIKWTPAQARRISRYSRRVICFDSQPEAQMKARELCNAVMGFPGETINVVLKGKDAAESMQEAKQLREMFLSK